MDTYADEDVDEQVRPKHERKYDLYSADFRASAHDVYARMRAADPVLQQPGIDGETPIWFVTRYEHVEEVLRSDGVFVRDPATVSEEMAARFSAVDPALDAMINNHMLNRDGETHRRLRSLVSKAFTPAVVRALRPRIEAIAAELLDRVETQGRMELVADFAFPLPITVIAELLGIPVERQDDFRRWSNAFVRPAVTAEEQAALVPELQAFAAYMQQLVAARREAPGEDLLSRLIHVEEEGESLNESELFSMMTLLIIAGHETTVSLIGNAVLALLQHRSAWERMQDDADLIPGAVEELLRYDSPVDRALTRFVAADTTLGGQQLRQGDMVIAVLGAANRDETQFEDPDTLDIERAPNRHLAFGKGVHYCLGAPLARLEGEVALRALLDRFPDLRLDVDPADLAWRDVPLFRSLLRLPVRWGPA